MSSNATRFGGRAATLGGLLFAALFTLSGLGRDGTVPALEVLNTYWLFHMFELPTNALLALGLVALHRHQAGAVGRLGKVGAYMALFGLVFAVLGSVIIPVLELGLGRETEEGWLEIVVHAPSFFALLIGSLLFGVATVRAGILPRVGPTLLFAGAVTSFAMTFSGIAEGWPRLVPAIILGLGWVWLRSALPAEPREASGRASWAN